MQATVSSYGLCPVLFRHPRRSLTLTNRFIFLCLVGVFFMAPPASALNPDRSVYQYNCRTWKRTNGLPSNAINAIAQTADGRVWLGTSKGLVQFDGADFRTYGLPGDKGSGARIITTLAPRTAGGLWVGLDRGSFGYFDGALFHSMQNDDWGGAFTTARTVREAKSGALLVATTRTAGIWPVAGPPQHYIAGREILSLREDATGRIWLGTANNGLRYWDAAGLHLFPEPAGENWKDLVIHDVVLDRTGNIWVATSASLHAFNPDFSPRVLPGIRGIPRVMLVDSHGVLWIGTLGEGLMRYKDGQFSVLHKSDGLASDRISSLAESDDGSLWVGTEDGLSLLTDVKFPIISVADGLVADSCLSVAASPRGGIWAGTVNGLSLYRDGQFKNYGFDKADGFYSGWVKRIFAAKNDDVYFIGGTIGLARFSKGRVDKTWLPSLWPRAIAEDSRGIIVAVAYDLMRIEHDELVPYLTADGKKVTLPWINELRVARDGSLWIASEGGIVQIKDGVLHDWSAPQQLTDKVFFYLCEDDAGAMWAARNNGLVRVKNGQMSFINRTRGLYVDFVYAIVPDNAGNFWMDCNEGIFRVSQQELNAVADGAAEMVHCTVYDGQQAIKTTDKSAQEYSGANTPDGRIWFPSSKGVIMIDPANVPNNNRQPSTYLLRVLVNGREYPVDRATVLEPGPGNLEFDNTALDYQAPERIRYRYRLEGYQTEWVEAGARRSAFYTNLSPGNYRFQVQACNADGVWNTAGASYELVLPRWFYQTVWFQIGLTFAVLGLLSSLWWGRERRQQTELAEVHRREELQRVLIDSSPVAMMMTGAQHRVLHLNDTFTQLFGHTLAEVPTLHAWWSLAFPDPAYRAGLQAEWIRRTALTIRPIEPLEASVTCKDGSVRTILFTTSEVGERMLAVFSDITERKRAEALRQSLEAQVRQAQKMEAVGQLSGGVAHDFNNLLTVILGNLSMLSLDTNLTPDLSGPLAEITEAAKRAANLTRQLLAFSRKQPLRLNLVDLEHTVNEMTRMLRRILGEDIHLQFQPSTEPALIRADESMIEQVLLNFAVNARDAMPEGGNLRIEIEVCELTPNLVPPHPKARAGRFVTLTVTDTGCGIPPDILPRIFEPFFTTKDTGKGTGLGLATVYGIVEQHEGWIIVNSEVGRGTTFRIFFPCQAAALDPEAAEAAISTPPLPFAGHVILLVEDEASVRSLVRRVLVRQGYRVLEAASGPAALEVWRLHRDKIDLVFTDLVMPDGIGGQELARLLRLEAPNIPIIFTSGYSASIAGKNFPFKEGVDFLAKPYDHDKLLKIITATLRDLPPRPGTTG